MFQRLTYRLHTETPEDSLLSCSGGMGQNNISSAEEKMPISSAKSPTEAVLPRGSRLDVSRSATSHPKRGSAQRILKDVYKLSSWPGPEVAEGFVSTWVSLSTPSPPITCCVGDLACTGTSIFQYVPPFLCAFCLPTKNWASNRPSHGSLDPNGAKNATRWHRGLQRRVGPGRLLDRFRATAGCNQ